MCDQTQVSYLPGDIVWVKLSNVWWPAEVQNEADLDEEVTGGLKKKPLAVVKFFNEDSYEFPKNLDQIYHYNCLRKDEFIKKGLDLKRASKKANRSIPSSMDKFPEDVTLAEEKTHGNPAYVDDPKFAPLDNNKRLDQSVSRDVTPAKKIKIEEKESSPFLRIAKSMKTPSPRVTFSIPNSKGNKMSTPKSLSKKIIGNNGTPQSILKKSSISDAYSPGGPFYRCILCDKYLTRHRKLITVHMTQHYSGELLERPPVIPKRYQALYDSNVSINFGNLHGTSLNTSSEKSGRKRKKTENASPKKKKNELVEKGTVKPSPISKDLGHTVPSKKQSKKVKTEVVESEALDLLKDWDDFSDDEAQLQSKTIKETGPPSESVVSPKIDEASQVTNATKSTKSCFDFEDNDDSLHVEHALKFGQKLPRVISDKQSNRKRTDSRNDDQHEDIGKEVDTFLKTVEVPELLGIPQKAPSSNENDIEKKKSSSEKKHEYVESILSSSSELPPDKNIDNKNSPSTTVNSSQHKLIAEEAVISEGCTKPGVEELEENCPSWNKNKSNEDDLGGSELHSTEKKTSEFNSDLKSRRKSTRLFSEEATNLVDSKPLEISNIDCQTTSKSDTSKEKSSTILPVSKNDSTSEVNTTIPIEDVKSIPSENKENDLIHDKTDTGNLGQIDKASAGKTDLKSSSFAEEFEEIKPIQGSGHFLGLNDIKMKPPETKSEEWKHKKNEKIKSSDLDKRNDASKSDGKKEVRHERKSKSRASSEDLKKYKSEKSKQITVENDKFKKSGSNGKLLGSEKNDKTIELPLLIDKNKRILRTSADSVNRENSAAKTPEPRDKKETSNKTPDSIDKKAKSTKVPETSDKKEKSPNKSGASDKKDKCSKISEVGDKKEKEKNAVSDASEQKGRANEKREKYLKTSDDKKPVKAPDMNEKCVKPEKSERTPKHEKSEKLGREKNDEKKKNDLSEKHDKGESEKEKTDSKKRSDHSEKHDKSEFEKEKPYERKKSDRLSEKADRSAKLQKSKHDDRKKSERIDKSDRKEKHEKHDLHKSRSSPQKHKSEKCDLHETRTKFDNREKDFKHSPDKSGKGKESEISRRISKHDRDKSHKSTSLKVEEKKPLLLIGEGKDTNKVIGIKESITEPKVSNNNDSGLVIDKLSVPVPSLSKELTVCSPSSDGVSNLASDSSVCSGSSNKNLMTEKLVKDLSDHPGEHELSDRNEACEEITSLGQNLEVTSIKKALSKTSPGDSPATEYKTNLKNSTPLSPTDTSSNKKTLIEPLSCQAVPSEDPFLLKEKNSRPFSDRPSKVTDKSNVLLKPPVELPSTPSKQNSKISPPAESAFSTRTSDLIQPLEDQSGKRSVLERSNVVAPSGEISDLKDSEELPPLNIEMPSAVVITSPGEERISAAPTNINICSLKQNDSCSVPEEKPYSTSACSSLTAQDIASLDITSMPIEIEPSDSYNMDIEYPCNDPEQFSIIPGSRVLTVHLRRKGEPFPEGVVGTRFTIKYDPEKESNTSPGLQKLPFPFYKPENEMEKNDTSHVSPASSVPTLGPAKGTVSTKSVVSNGDTKSLALNSNSLSSPQKTPLNTFSIRQTQSTTKNILLKVANSSKVGGNVTSSLPQNSLKKIKIINSPSNKCIFLTPRPLNSTASLGPTQQNISCKTSLASKTTSNTIVNSNQVVKIPISLPTVVPVVKKNQGNLVPKILPTVAGTKVTGFTQAKSKNIINIKQNTVKRVQLSSTSSPKASSSNPTNTLIEDKTITKLRQPSPNILQKSPRKSGKRSTVNKTEVGTVQTPTLVSVPNIGNNPLQSILQNVPSSSEPVIYLAIDNPGNFQTVSPSVSLPIHSGATGVSSTGMGQQIKNVKSSGQDILAEALANTQVLQSDFTDLDNYQFVSPPTTTALTNNVLETSLTLNQPPIMTPLEVPSSIPVIGSDNQTVYLTEPSTFQLIVTQQESQEQNLIVTEQQPAHEESLQNKEENVLPEFFKGGIIKKHSIRKSFGDR